MTDDFQQKLDAYIKEHYDPNINPEVEDKLACINAFGRAAIGAACLLPEAIDALLAEKAETFSEKMLKVMKKHKLKSTDVYKRADISKSMFSKIKRDPDYHPSKDVVVAILMALHADKDESKDLLNRAGYELSDGRERDLIMRGMPYV